MSNGAAASVAAATAKRPRPRPRPDRVVSGRSRRLARYNKQFSASRIPELYPFHNFEEIIGKLTDVLQSRGLLCIVNTNYRLEDTSVAARFECVSLPRRLTALPRGCMGRLTWRLRPHGRRICAVASRRRTSGAADALCVALCARCQPGASERLHQLCAALRQERHAAADSGRVRVQEASGVRWSAGDETRA